MILKCSIFAESLDESLAVNMTAKPPSPISCLSTRDLYENCANPGISSLSDAAVLPKLPKRDIFFTSCKQLPTCWCQNRAYCKHCTRLWIGLWTGLWTFTFEIVTQMHYSHYSMAADSAVKRCLSKYTLLRKHCNFSFFCTAYFKT